MGMNAGQGSPGSARFPEMQGGMDIASEYPHVTILQTSCLK